MGEIVVLLFIGLLLLIIWILSWIYDLITIREVIEFYPNGQTKLKGSTRFKKRIGKFELFDEKGTLTLTLTYGNGNVYLEEYRNTSTGKVWKKIEHNNGVLSTKIDFSAIPDNADIDQPLVLEAVKSDWRELQNMPYKYKNDREVVLEAVGNHGWALQYVSDELKKDREVVMEAVRNDGTALEHASKELKKDREVVLEAELTKVRNSSKE